MGYNFDIKIQFLGQGFIVFVLFWLKFVSLFCVDAIWIRCQFVSCMEKKTPGWNLFGGLRWKSECLTLHITKLVLQAIVPMMKSLRYISFHKIHFFSIIKWILKSKVHMLCWFVFYTGVFFHFCFFLFLLLQYMGWKNQISYLEINSTSIMSVELDSFRPCFFL